jgi:hypothetical protein
MDRYAHLYRLARGDQGTQGVLHYNNERLYTIELPWRKNMKNISCIPKGEYFCETRVSPRFGLVYWIKDVPNRSFILIHSGNWAGDVSKGYKAHVNGCILLGLQNGTLQGQLAVLNSRLAVNKFMREMEKEPFRLKIFENF